jgi:cephalosporin-C deacetylase
MKRVIRLSSIILIFTGLSASAQFPEIILKQTNQTGIYKRGQKISVFAFPENQAGDSLHVRVLKNNSQQLEKKAIPAGKDSTLVYESFFGDPCSVIVEVRAGGGISSIGILVDPQKIKPGVSCPKDFYSFWDGQKKALDALPFVVKSVPVTDIGTESGISCADIEINCTGLKPVHGYYAKPGGAAPGSLPAVLLVKAAGVKGSWCRSEPRNAIEYAKKGAICFDLNAHGMLDGQPESYYTGLETGELKNYYLQGVTSRDDFYFRGMYLRLLRTIEFLTRQPEWDGKRILVIGESQGGGQALAAAGLDHRVSAVVAIVPAMCDFMGALAGRRGGWPQPFETDASKEEMKKTLPYYDNANILKGSKAIIFAEVGMIDLTCPPASVFAAINQAKGKKIIYPVPYRGHQNQALQGSKSKIWEETVYKPREAFINSYLK